MTNPQFGFAELSAAQSQPEVVVNAADRAITNALAGEVTIDFQSDADHELQATTPLASSDEWAYGTIVMTDTGVVLTTARSVIFPDLDSIYGGTSRPRFVFKNDTQQTLTIKGDSTSATGVEVGSGESALVRFNGTDVEEVAASGGSGGSSQNVPIQIAASQFGEALQSGNTVAYFRAPFAATIQEVRASVLVPNTTGDLEVDIKVDGVSILSEPIVIEQGEKSSKTAADQPELVSGASFADDDEVTIDIDAPTGADAEALIVTLIVTP